jgi:maltose alpha-D-glucosyltransferase/alpha-amylase
MPTGPTRADAEAALTRLDLAAIADQRWFGAKGRTIARVELDEAFILDPDVPHVLAVATFTLDDGGRHRYSLALTGAPLREARPGDGGWRALALAMAAGRIVPALPDAMDAPPTSPSAVLVCRPASAMPADGPGKERDLGADQSNTSVVLGDDVLLKAYRRLQPGLNPDLEMTAFLSEEAGFGAVPPLAGYAELVERRHGTTTVAMAQRFVADGSDAFESIAETLTAWLLAPGSVSLEFATEVADELGALTAGLHAAVADGHGLPDMAPRPATRAELRAWSAAARANLGRALEVTPDDHDASGTLRQLAPRIGEALTVLDALPTTPEIIRAHGDLHLGQILIADDGYRVIDFEGEPSATLDERRAHRHPLRDVASMLRSLDHVAGSAARRAERWHGGPLERTGLDLAGWRRRARERFIDAYREGLLAARVVPELDPALLRAFEIDKELYEFAYAATYLPFWLWAPTEGMRGLFPEGDA